ncbi:MAG: TOBE domain-containing protein [Syntrophomonadaceae bacterium]|nr:TOBE domain-containing protein [Syntrophomonadaceae bacterium]
MKTRTSARNQLKGKITAIDIGSVNVTVTIDIGGGNCITAMITKQSCEGLGLKVGGEAYAVIKASSVMVGID